MPNESNGLAPAPSQEDALAQDTTTNESFSGGDFADPGLDPLAGSGSAKKMNGGLILIVTVILIAVAGLFSMRKLAQVTAAAGIDSEIESTIEEFLDSKKHNASASGTDSGDDEVVLAVLSETYSERQVPLRDIRRDPFTLQADEVVEVPIATKDPEDLTLTEHARLEKLRDETRIELERSANTLRVKAIMGGSSPLANINGETVRVGETVTTEGSGPAFRVIAISRSSVDIVASVPDLDLTVNVTLHLQR